MHGVATEVGRLVAPPPGPRLRSSGARSSSRPETLTARERDVITLLSDGMTAVAIGRRLGISPRTVHKHLENIYAKLDVADRVSAVLRAQSSAVRAR